MTASMSEVSKRYGRTTALHPTTVTIDRGVVGLLGPNGAGKTTMLRLLSSALPPTTGSISVAGHEVTGSHAERTRARRMIGYVPQEVAFPRAMTAFGFVDYIAVLKEWRETGRRHHEVRRVLGLVDLGDRATMKVRALSGGQRRRLAIAQALLGSPELLILDEPTTGLDPEQRATLRGVLSGLAGSVLLSTHQTEDIAALCDRVIVLEAGAVRFDGSVPELLALAEGQVHLSAQASAGAVATWRTGTSLVRSVGGSPAPDARLVDPTVEDAYLLLRKTVPPSSEGT